MDINIVSELSAQAEREPNPHRYVRQLHERSAIEIVRLRTALADAIHCPEGVVPPSADGLVSRVELKEAKGKRQRHTSIE